MIRNKHAEFHNWNDWTDPDFFAEGRQTEQRFLPLFLRQLLPVRAQKTQLTLTGWMLIIVALGIGTAAYNTGSNILFLTLSLLLSSLVLSGILSWINFRKLQWHLKFPAHLQAGEVGAAEIEMKNRKRVFPSMSIGFRLGTSESAQDSTLYMSSALAAGATTCLEWTFTPHRRGILRLSFKGARSKFPFGFLNKTYGQAQEHPVLVWPSRTRYDFSPQPAGRRHLAGVSRRSAGLGSDLLHIRNYERGDPPRLIHWKATARLNKLMIRQLAQEGESGFSLEIEPVDELWSGARFERLCSVACSLADDLFHAGRLDSVGVGGVERITIRTLRDLHGFYDCLAELSPVARLELAEQRQNPKNRITFRPLGEGGVAIYVDGIQIGQSDD